MPHYANVDELPSTIRDVLPPEAQQLYLEVYNQTWEKHKNADTGTPAETAAHRLAWNMVNKEFVLVEVDDHKQWYRRGEEPTPEETNAANQGILDRIKNIF